LNNEKILHTENGLVLYQTKSLYVVRSGSNDLAKYQTYQEAKVFMHKIINNKIKLESYICEIDIGDTIIVTKEQEGEYIEQNGETKYIGAPLNERGIVTHKEKIPSFRQNLKNEFKLTVKFFNGISKSILYPTDYVKLISKKDLFLEACSKEEDS
jgi:hypothetical protein